jgi:hypothetical protein
MSLIREQIIGKPNATPPLRVPGTEFGPDAFVRKLTVLERFEFNKLRDKLEDDPTGDARIAVFLLCDDTGSRVFTDADATYLAAQSGYADSIRWICEAGYAFNSTTLEDHERAKKNSPGIGNESLLSGSPAN